MGNKRITWLVCVELNLFMLFMVKSECFTNRETLQTLLPSYIFLLTQVRETRPQVQGQWTFKTPGALDNEITMFVIPHTDTLPKYGKKNVDVRRSTRRISNDTRKLFM